MPETQAHGDISQELKIVLISILTQTANLRGFRASVNPRFEAGIPDFMNGILNFSIHFNVVHRKVDWRNPKMKSLNSMPARSDWLVHQSQSEFPPVRVF